MTPASIADVLEGRAGWTVVHGDCLDVLPTLPDRSVAHVITDPPYSEHVHGKSRAGASKKTLRDGNGHITRCAIEREVDFGFAHLTTEVMEAVADQCARLASRWTLAFCDVESSHLWSGALRSAGLDYCRTGAWVKVGATPQFTGDRPGVGFEAVVVCHQPGRKKWNGGGHAGVWTHLTCIDRGSPSGTADRCHPTQKPLPLMTELVELFTDPGDIVLDPFAGSGSTGVACVRLGRRFIGIEKDATYAALATQRLEAEVSGSTLSAARAGQVALFGGRS
jgi:site-specific DNA-methyltransferase (adenine-specific)